jgi:hypothetical protein
MNDPWTKGLPRRHATPVQDPKEQGISQGTPVIPCPGMHHHALGLIHYHYLLIFIDNIQGQVLRD